MSLHRAALIFATGLFIAGMTSAASAGCCDRGLFTSSGYVATGCCGTPSAAIIYAQPVAPMPPPVQVPAVVNTWSNGCGCHDPVVYSAPMGVAPMPVAPSPIYVTDQGPTFTGPGVMVPYHTWNPEPTYARVTTYPPYAGYGYGYEQRPRVRVVYRERFYAHPHGPLPLWRTHGPYYSHPHHH